MGLTSRDSQTLAMLLPCEAAVAFLLLRLHFPATWLAGESGGMIDYIGQRWIVSAVRQ